MTTVSLTTRARTKMLGLGFAIALWGLAAPAAAQSTRWSSAQRRPQPATSSHAIVQRASGDEVRPLNFTLSLNLHQSWQLDDGNQLFGDERNVGGGGLSLAYRVVDLSPQLALHVLVDWQAEESEGTWLLGSTRLENHALAAGVLVRYEPRWWVAPFLRVAAGANFARARLDLEGGELADEARSPFSMAGLGVSFRTWAYKLGVSGPQLRLSFDIEGGFTLAQDLDFTMKPDATVDAEDAIPVEGVPIGAVGRSRPHLRFSLSAHF